MAVSSVGGSEPTETPTNIAATGADAQQPAQGSEAAPVQEVGKPYAVIDGVEFKDQAALTEWYNERQAGEDTQAGQDTQTGTDTQAATERTDDDIRASLKEAGGIFADPKYEPFALEFEKTGALSEDSIKAAAEAFGQTPEVVKAFIDGQKAQRELAKTQAAAPSKEAIASAAAILEVVPNEADYKALLAWGKDGLTKSEQAAYDKALDAGDADTVKALLGAYNAKFQASGQGKSPRDVTAEGSAEQTNSGGGAKPYASQAQMSADMNKREYATDPAFRAEVAARVAVSKF